MKCDVCKKRRNVTTCIHCNISVCAECKEKANKDMYGDPILDQVASIINPIAARGKKA